MELAITLVVALIGVLNALLATGIWFKLGGLTVGQQWIVGRLKRMDGDIEKIDDRITKLERDYNVLAINSGANNPNNRESYPRHQGKG